MKQKKQNLIKNIIALFLLCSNVPAYARILFSTITVPGYYRLADDLNNSITITVSNVTLDLNGHTVSNTGNGIIINPGLTQVTVLGGAITATGDAIQVNAGCSNITLDNLTARNSTLGIAFTSVTDAFISSCELTMNTTGLQLNGCQNINVSDTVANNNIHAGFDLISSTTCLFEDCKALSTGQGNITTANNQVVGFSTVNGYGNIFERCIANSTQALSTIDSSSIVAGFLFKGSESGSKIISSESSNATTSSSGFTVPYGILLQGTVSQYSSVTGALNGSTDLFALAWSPDGQYVAVGGQGLSGLSDTTQIVQFNRATNSYSPIAGALNGSIEAVALSWSPDGQYVAIGGDNLVGSSNVTQILQFDRTTNSYSSVAGALNGGGIGASVDAIAWSPDGRYVAVGGSGLVGLSSSTQILQFNSVTNTYTPVAGALNSGGAIIVAIAWSPDGQYVAVGGSGLPGLSDATQILQFNKSNNSYIPVAGALNGGTVRTLSWSSDGQYIAVGGNNLPGLSDSTQILQFNRTTNAYTPVVGALNGSLVINTLCWSPDGQFVAVGGRSLSGLSNSTQILQFNRSSNTYIPVVGALNGSTAVLALSWSPDGQLVAVGGSGLSGSSNVNQILTGLNFPTNNVITNNTVYCNSGGQFPSGVGISGPSICNLIIGNTAYANPISISTNHPIVTTNYNFACNVFNQQFGQAPTSMQNISLGSCEPIAQPIDTALIDQQILFNITVLIPSELEIIQSLIEQISIVNPTSQLNVIESKIDANDCCSMINAINSKIDNINIIESLVAIDTSLLNVIESQIISISSKEDVISSQINTLQIFDSINDLLIESYLSTLESKSDKIISQLNVIESKIDSDDCCSMINAINSKIDNINIIESLVAIDTSLLNVIESQIISISSKEDVISSQINTLQIFDSINDLLIESYLSTLESKSDKISSQLDIIESKIDADDCCSTINAINSKIDIANSNINIIETYVEANNSILNLLESQVANLACPEPTTIKTAQTISTAGSYILCNTITGTITIAASNVTLDLNNYQVTQGIVVNSGLSNVTIKNGTVLNSAGAQGIQVGGSTSNVAIKNVTVENALVGIQFNANDTNALIDGCTLTSNTTGLQLNNAHNITVNNTTANQNSNAGFDLISSMTNIFRDCQALSTGQGNTVAFNNEVVGFSSANGYGNIFERCIANSTQALSTTDSNSIVAGFALLGNEQGSKIIGCEASNGTTSSAGFTVPYGIYLQDTVGSTLTLTGYPPIPLPNDAYAVDWSPDGRYVAVGTDSTTDLFGIYSYNRATNIFQQIATPDQPPTQTVFAAVWHPNGRYLAVGAGGSTAYLAIFAFNPVNNSLLLITTPNVAPLGSSVVQAAWSPDGNYLAVTSAAGFQLYYFNLVAQTLTLTATIATSAQGVAWSPDGNYLLLGFSSSPFFSLYSLNRQQQSLSLVTTVSTDTMRVIKWTSDGEYVAVQDQTASQLQIYQFNGNAQSLSLRTALSGANVAALAWSPNNRYLANGQSTGPLQLYYYDRAANILTLKATSNISAINATNMIAWSPDGELIVRGGLFNIPNFALEMYQVLQFPTHNVITNNMVYDNSGGQFPSGVGISGPSICNMIIGNTAYANPIPVTANQPIVSNNYYFVCNVFNQLFGQAPTALQNIALGGCGIIAQPVDVGLLAEQILYDVTVPIPSQLAVISSKEDAIGSKIDNLACPAPTTIKTAQTILASGSYILCNNITGTITIAASNVALDLNNYQVTQGLVINSGLSNVTVKNGTVLNSANAQGIQVGGGTSNVMIKNVTVENALVGIQFNPNDTNALIDGCTLTANTTGLQLNNTHNITVNNTTANQNIHAGFDLLSSTTNTFRDCQALSTGQGNTVAFNNEVVGFSSANGYGNIFERCIANSTQALSTTDSNSIIAGFVLSGSEGSSKIINCESSNAMTSPSGYTVPYGILLQGSMGQLISVTGAISGDEVNGTSWSPDGQYIAVGGEIVAGNNPFLQIYSFNRVNRSLNLVTITILNTTGSIGYVSWSPDGQYVAIAGALSSEQNFQIYSFDRNNNSLNFITEIFFVGEVFGISWSPDEQFIAIALDNTSGNALQIYSFNRVNGSLNLLAGAANIANAQTVSWAPDGQYIALGLSSGSNRLQIYSFSNGSLSLVTGAINDSSFINSVAWSADGEYILVGGSLQSGNEVQIYSFNRNNGSLNLVTTAVPVIGLGGVDSAFWSSDGQYVAVAGSALSVNQFQIYSFNRSNGSLNLVTGALSSATLATTSWSPDGQYIAVGGTGLSGNQFQIFSALQFPSHNIITNNTVYCNSGAQFPSGVGISGPSICNMIIGNTCYSNPIPIGVNQPPAGTNYYFLCNVFSQFFGQIPSELQNIALDGCGVITQPVNVGLLADQILYNVTGPITSQLNVIASAVEALDLCGSIPLTSANILGGTITLSASGNYCLSTDLTTNLVITGTNVTVNLNDRALTGTITISSNDVNIINGFIRPSAPSSTPAAAITVSSLSSQIVIQNININCAASTTDASVAGRAGISISSNNTQISNCTISAGAGSATSGGVVAGAGGIGIEVAGGSNIYISGCSVTGGNGGSSAGGAPGANGGVSIQVDNGATKVEIVDSIIYNSGSGGSTVAAATPGGDAGTGISLSGDDAQVIRCTIKTASGGAGNGTSGAGGAGILVGSTATKNLIRASSIVTGSGGTGGNGTGGNGGAGISIAGATRTEILDCIIYGTGNGGSVSTGTGGNGGHGISISSSSTATSVRNCTIRNTGIPGAGTTGSPLSGKAIFDQSTGTGVSSIYANFANNIANGTKFDLLAMGLESGVLLPNPPTATVINPYANVYSS